MLTRNLAPLDMLAQIPPDGLHDLKLFAQRQLIHFCNAHGLTISADAATSSGLFECKMKKVLHGSWASTLRERRYRGVFAEVFAVAEGLEEAVAEEFEFIQDGEACRPRGEWLAAQSGDGSPQSESVGGMSCGIGVPLRDVRQGFAEERVMP